MQHSLFDRIYMAFLLILIVSFGVLILYISIFTRKSLIDEKNQTLVNEATLIAAQSVGSYVSGELTPDELSLYFDSYSNRLKADIWFVDSMGNIVARSSSVNTRDTSVNVIHAQDDHDTEENSTPQSMPYVKPVKEIPANIYIIDGIYPLYEVKYDIGTFYDLYDESVITVSVPVAHYEFNKDGTINQIPNVGVIILNSSASQIDSMLNNIYSISLFPCLVIIIIAFTFLGIISRKIIRPIRHLSDVARTYSEGNFDVKTGITSKDEIGQLADSMEYMADELSKLEQYRHDFVSNISHDFRSPLTSIKGYVQAILDGTIPIEKQERYLNIVLDETQRLTKLTQGLLDLNHLEIYGPYLKMDDFDVIDIVKTTLNTFEIKCIDKDIAIYLNNHAEHTVVTADKTKIQQVIYNLIDNAIKFTPSGKKIYVTINEKDEKLYVYVRDEGVGMDDSTQKKIWTRFYKGDASRGKDKQGTGLGLAITKEIIKAHNETIEVTSKEGQGSQFMFTLTKSKGSDEPTHSGQTEILMSK